MLYKKSFVISQNPWNATYNKNKLLLYTIKNAFVGATMRELWSFENFQYISCWEAI